MTTAVALSLSKGQNISLSKHTPGLKKIIVGLGWQARISHGENFDLDASALLLNSNGKVPTNSYFVYYNQQKSACGSVESSGDDLTGGDGNGDDETLTVDLSRVPDNIDKIVFPVTIYDSNNRRQNFGQVLKSHIRVLNAETNQEITRYDLTEDASNLDAMIFGEVYRDPADRSQWKFRAVGQGFSDGLGGIARAYGVQI